MKNSLKENVKKFYSTKTPDKFNLIMLISELICNYHFLKVYFPNMFNMLLNFSN